MAHEEEPMSVEPHTFDLRSDAAIRKLLVKSCRELLRACELDTTGSRQVLIQRIIDATAVGPVTSANAQSLSSLQAIRHLQSYG
eukprot:1061911-Rhodomonas_salina.1